MDREKTCCQGNNKRVGTQIKKVVYENNLVPHPNSQEDERQIDAFKIVINPIRPGYEKRL